MKKENERRNLNERKKLFTKNKCNNIISKDYNPLNKAQQISSESGELNMKKKDVILDKLLKELNYIERTFFKKKFIKLYNKARINIISTMLK